MTKTDKVMAVVHIAAAIVILILTGTYLGSDAVILEVLFALAVIGIFTRGR